MLALAFSVMGFSAYALTTNAVLILTTAAGLSLPQVATIQAISGASILVGRIGFGVLLDRFNGALVALFAVVLGGSVFVSYGLGGSFNVIVATAIMAGVSIGGESDLMPYLAGRYFGRDAVSSVFGWFLSAFVIGAALGPVVFAQAASALGSAVPVLFAVAALHIVPASLFILLFRRG
jgi:MFS family permease